MILVKRLTKTAKMPHRANLNDAGLDLFADESVVIPGYGRSTIRTGIAISLDPCKVGLIWPRSSLAAKGISTDAGVVDSGYRGEVKVVLTNSTPDEFAVFKGQKIAQMLVQFYCPDEINEVDELPSSLRGLGGFGSSD